MNRLCVCIAGVIACLSAMGQESVSITSQKSAWKNPYVVAVPQFVTAPGKEALGIELAKIVAQDLDFSGVCRVVPAQQYPPDFTGFTKDFKQINFESWDKVGVEYVAHVYVVVEGDSVSLECRFFDVVPEDRLMGVRWGPAAIDDRRRLSHLFSERIIRELDGIPGIATSQIVFSAGELGKKEIYVADYDGANVRQVTKFGSISILPQFSPDGEKVVYLSYKDRFPFLYIQDLKSGDVTALSKKTGLNVAPAWSPDGKELAMVLSKDANAEIYLVKPDGSNLRRLTRDPAVDTSPTFSPDGKRIGFIRNAQVLVMNADGRNAKRLSYQGGRSYDPAWSPDGKMIAYVVEQKGAGLEIYVCDVDNPESARRLTDSVGGNEAPSWSADSRHVMFATTRRGASQLWVVDVETGRQRPVSGLNRECQGPDWGPRRN